MSIKVGVSGILVPKYLELKVLLGRRVADDESLPGMWCTPGGGVEKGETLNQALVREFKEETGLDVVPSVIVSVEERDPKSPKGQCIMIFKTVFWRPDPSQSIDFSPGDGFDALELFTHEDIIKRQSEITPMTFNALQMFFWKYN
jgi:8-oxo-dGTP pyrophosphatase MutT (NUDIX family)